jgi:3-hydroxyacyl-CoA dehydrogenase
MIESRISDGVCTLRLNAPPVNAIDLPLLDALREAVGEASAREDVRGIVLMGDARHFSAGADVGLFRDVRTPEEAVRLSRLFQEAFQAVEDSTKPVVAAVAGRVMGSALELAMACHGRVATRTTRFSMPEVRLGINPGAGGTQRLPRLIGVRPALEMLLAGSSIDAERALALGLVDAVCDGDELEDAARALPAARPLPRRTSALTDKVSDAADNVAAFEEAERRLAKSRPEIIGPRVILEAVQAGLGQSVEAGLAREQTGFAECMQTRATQNRIHLFFATREAGKMPAGDAAPAAVERAAVIGMGSMGTGIAQAFAMSGIPVAVRDAHPAAVERGLGRIRESLKKRHAQGKLDADRCRSILAHVTVAKGWNDVAGADLVIEAVVEDPAVKRAVLGEVEAAVRPGALVASNTSTLSLDDLAEGMRRPERLVGLHFFNPAHRMPLVEVVRRESTPDAVVATALTVGKRLGKTAVLVRNREGFLVNRLFIPYLKEAFEVVADGADPSAVDAAMVGFGLPMGPLALIDMAGLDILADTSRVLTRAFPRHGPLSPVAVRLVERGHLGQKTGAGVYRYEPGDRTPHPSEETARIVAEVQEETGRPPRRIGTEKIVQRLVLVMVSEAACVLAEGIARCAADLDVATVLGMGFPDWRGGVVTYARDLGLDRVRADLEALTAEHGERFAPCDSLNDLQGA